MDTTELEVQLFELRDRYDALVSQRIEHLTMTGYFETAVPDACDNECTEIWALEDWMEQLREKLIKLNPTKWHFGKTTGKGRKQKASTKGDYGFYYCRECGGIFKFMDYKKEKKLGNERESFACCKEHFGRKKDGTITLKKEELKWL
jgi:hypothetical protein